MQSSAAVPLSIAAIRPADTTAYLQASWSSWDQVRVISLVQTIWLSSPAWCPASKPPSRPTRSGQQNVGRLMSTWSCLRPLCKAGKSLPGFFHCSNIVRTRARGHEPCHDSALCTAGKMVCMVKSCRTAAPKRNSAAECISLAQSAWSLKA